MIAHLASIMDRSKPRQSLIFYSRPRFPLGKTEHPNIVRFPIRKPILCEFVRYLFISKFHFDHNFFKSKRIDFRFCTLAKLEKLNNFYLYRIEDYPNKKSRNCDFRLYLARARARARARPSRALGPPALTQKG